MRNKIIEIAQNEVGYREYSDNHTKYGEWFGVQDEWCNIFVSWACNQAEISTDIVPKQSYVPTTYNWFKNKKLFKARGTYTPLKGDIVLFDYNKNGTPDHIGFVENVANNKLITIEGNKSKQVMRCTYDLNNTSIYGYCVPNYTIYEENKEVTVSEQGKIAQVQTYLNQKYNFSLAVDNIFGTKTKSALVKALQTEFNNLYNSGLVVDGIFGVKTKSACRNIKNGTRGNIIYLIQAMLICKGYDLVLDGIFGNNTLSAVKDFQSKNGLTVDGIVGKNTFTKLFA